MLFSDFSIIVFCPLGSFGKKKRKEKERKERSLFLLLPPRGVKRIGKARIWRSPSERITSPRHSAGLSNPSTLNATANLYVYPNDNHDLLLSFPGTPTVHRPYNTLGCLCCIYIFRTRRYVQYTYIKKFTLEFINVSFTAYCVWSYFL